MLVALGWLVIVYDVIWNKTDAERAAIEAGGSIVINRRFSTYERACACVNAAHPGAMITLNDGSNTAYVEDKTTRSGRRVVAYINETELGNE